MKRMNFPGDKMPIQHDEALSYPPKLTGENSLCKINQLDQVKLIYTSASFSLYFICYSISVIVPPVAAINQIASAYNEKSFPQSFRSEHDCVFDSFVDCWSLYSLLQSLEILIYVSIKYYISQVPRIRKKRDPPRISFLTVCLSVCLLQVSVWYINTKYKTL